jgi:hypothetical protein
MFSVFVWVHDLSYLNSFYFANPIRLDAVAEI